jgi:precorrin isomerase
LFNYVIDWTMKQALADYPGVQLSPEEWISDLEFADDIVVLGDTPTALQPILDRILLRKGHWT